MIELPQSRVVQPKNFDLVNWEGSARQVLVELRALRASVDRLYNSVKRSSNTSDQAIEMIMCAAAQELAPDWAARSWSTWMRGRRRGIQELSTARMAAEKLCIDLLGLGLHHVAQRFKRHHTTIVHACRAIADLCETDPEFRERYQALEARLRASLHLV